MLWHCWLSGRKGIQPVKTECEVLAWLSVWLEVQMICICSSWCIISSSSKIQNGLPSGVLLKIEVGIHWTRRWRRRHRRRRGRTEPPNGEGKGSGCPLPSRLGGLGSIVTSPVGSGAKPQPKTVFSAFRAWKNTICWLVIVFILVLYDTYFAFFDGLSV